MSTEEPKLRPDTDPPDADEQWEELQQKLEGQKPAEEEIIEGDEVNSAAKAEAARVMRKLLSGI